MIASVYPDLTARRGSIPGRRRLVLQTPLSAVPWPQNGLPCFIGMLPPDHPLLPHSLKEHQFLDFLWSPWKLARRHQDPLPSGFWGAAGWLRGQRCESHLSVTWRSAPFPGIPEKGKPPSASTPVIYQSAVSLHPFYQERVRKQISWSQLN